MNVTIKQLQTFTTVARFGSFVEAATVLHVTPAALSISVRELESILGIRLLERTTRSVRLTSAGRQYLACAERVLLELRTADLCATDLRERGSGIVRIATTELVTLTLLLPALVAIRKHRPEIRPILIDIPGIEGAASVETGQADIAIAIQVPTDANIVATPLFRSQLHFVCESRHRLARRKKLHWDDIAAESLVFVGQGARLRIATQLPKHLEMNSTYEADNASAALAMVASGFGGAICSGYIKPIVLMHKLCIIPLVEPAVIRPFVLYTMKSSDHAPTITLHKKLLSEHFAHAKNTCIESHAFA